MTQGIDVTVAAVVERDGRFLIVEERAGGHVVLNQPAGHLELGETLLEAVIRETREETGYRFTPQYLVGMYLWQSENGGPTFLRVTFSGKAEAPTSPTALDEGIIAAHWFSRAQLLSHQARLRSPMVLRCLDDYLAGHRFSLDCLKQLLTLPQIDAQATG